MALFLQTNLQPKLVPIDMSVDQIFRATVKVVGYIDRYRLKIYNSANDAELYDSTLTTVSPLYNNDILEVVVPSTSGVPNGIEAYWTLEYGTATETLVGRQTVYFTSSAPIFTLDVDPVATSQSFTVAGSYSQSEGVGLSYWYYELYDDDGDLIEQTDHAYNPSMSYEFTGLTNGSTYQIRAFGETQQQLLIQTDVYTFDVSYSQPTVVIVPELSILEDSVSLKADFGQADFIEGTSDGSTSYISNFMYSGNKGFDIDVNSLLKFSNISIGTTGSYQDIRKFDNDFIGTYLKLSNSTTNDYCKVGYDGNTFFKNINGNIEFSQVHLMDYSHFYLTVVQYEHVYILEFSSASLSTPINMFEI